jgi:RNA polymerase primary sigma factor
MDALSVYMRQVRRYELLAREREIDLAHRIQCGDDTAREQMILCNLRLVVKIAREYQRLGLPLLDLIAEGNIGLIRAAERFQPGRGAKFSTYASLWIKLGIRRALCNSARLVRLPVQLQQNARRARRARLTLRHALGREPNLEEIGKATGLSQASLDRCEAVPQTIVPLDAPLGDEEAETVGSILADETAASPQDHLLDVERAELLGSLLSRLSPRERRVIKDRFGLNGSCELTLQTLSTQLCLTREGIRQIERRALKKLRSWFQEREVFSSLA